MATSIPPHDNFGKRSKAARWPRGVSGKQNKSLPAGERNQDIVNAVFSDSQLRSAVERIVRFPQEWHINCTPGGRFKDIGHELMHSRSIENVSVSCVTLLVGTNNLGGDEDLSRSQQEFDELLVITRQRFPSSAILVVSILPRFDEKNRHLPSFKQMMVRLCVQRGANYVDLVPHFPLTKQQYWCRDGLHLSDDNGLPMLRNLMVDAVERARSTPQTYKRIAPPPGFFINRRSLTHSQTTVPGNLSAPKAMYAEERFRELPVSGIEKPNENQARTRLWSDVCRNIAIVEARTSGQKKEPTAPSVSGIDDDFPELAAVTRKPKKTPTAPSVSELDDGVPELAAVTPKPRKTPTAPSVSELDDGVPELAAVTPKPRKQPETIESTARKLLTLNDLPGSYHVFGNAAVKKVSPGYYSNMTFHPPVNARRKKKAKKQISTHFGWFVGSSVEDKSSRRRRVLFDTPLCKKKPEETNADLEHKPTNSVSLTRDSTSIEAGSIGKRRIEDPPAFVPAPTKMNRPAKSLSMTPIQAGCGSLTLGLSRFPNSRGTAISVKLRRANLPTGKRYSSTAAANHLTSCVSLFPKQSLHTVTQCDHMLLFGPLKKTVPELSNSLAAEEQSLLERYLNATTANSAVFPSSLKAVGSSAFNGCQGITRSLRTSFKPLSAFTYYCSKGKYDGRINTAHFHYCKGGGPKSNPKSCNGKDNLNKLMSLLRALGNQRLTTSSNINWDQVTNTFFSSKFAHLDKRRTYVRNLYYKNKDLIDAMRTEESSEEGDVDSIHEYESSVDIDMPPQESTPVRISNSHGTVQKVDDMYVDASNSGAIFSTTSYSNDILAAEARYIGQIGKEFILGAANRRFPISRSDIEQEGILHDGFTENVNNLTAVKKKNSPGGNFINPLLSDGNDDREKSVLHTRDKETLTIPSHDALSRIKTSRSSYSDQLIKSLSRTESNRGIRGAEHNQEIEARLPDQWKKIPILLKGKPGHQYRSFGPEFATFFSNILATCNSFCVWSFKKNHVKLANSRKKSAPFFTGMAKCSLEECGIVANLVIPSEHSNHVRIKFTGSVNHPKHSAGARRITGDAKERLSTIFKDNPLLPPSNQYREDLNKVNQSSFAAGNLTGASTSKMAYQRIASNARRKANSVDGIRQEIDSLKAELKKADEAECLDLGHTFRNNFGYIQRALIDDEQLQIVLMDQVMAILYHENVKNDILYIDATGLVTTKIKRLNRILYYAAVVRHPYGKTPPLPICEFITSNHDHFSIANFLGTIHEKEFQKYHITTNPRLILLDFSWAIILACLNEFCGEDTVQYLDRTLDIVNGIATESEIRKPLLHVCAAHMMKANKKNISVKYCRDLNKSSQVHFAMRVMGRLINCQTLPEAARILKKLHTVMTSEYANNAVKKSLQFIENSIETFEDEVDDGIDLNNLSEKAYEVDDETYDITDVGSPKFEKKGAKRKSAMHEYWEQLVGEMDLKLQKIPKDPQQERNRYFMPDYFNWLEAKLPFITLWSNICLGDIRRFNDQYIFAIPSISGNTFLIGNKTNASAEQYFNMKKAYKEKLELPLNQFIRKCWEDNRGLRRQFVNEWLKCYPADGDDKPPYRQQKARLEKIVKSTKRCRPNESDVVDDRPQAKAVEEQWNKKKVIPKKKKSLGTYQKPPKSKLHFFATASEKETHHNRSQNASKENRDSHSANSCFDDPNTEKFSCYDIDSDEDSLDLDADLPSSSILDHSIGYSVYKRAVYDEVRRQSRSMTEVRRKVRRSWDDMPEQDKQTYSLQADNDVCGVCNKKEAERGNGPTDLWILCTYCSSWYHTSCLLLDNAYACATVTYTCPECCKAALDGLPNFLYHFRNYRMVDLDVEDIISQWDGLPLDKQVVVKKHVYPFHDLFRNLDIGPFVILSERGITNHHNNCWSSSIFHILCGSIISRLIPPATVLNSDICRDLRSISSNLQRRLGPLPFTTAMKRMTRRVTGRDQTCNAEQDDASEFYQRLMRHFIDTGNRELREVFTAKTAHITKCLTCSCSKAIMYSNSLIRLPVYKNDCENFSVYSLLWEWCTMNDRENTLHRCKCSENVRNVIDRSYVMTTPAVLVLLIDRVQHDGTVNHVPIQISKNLDVQHLLAGNTDAMSVDYVLAGVVKHHGVVSSGGHYNCLLFGSGDQAINFDDTDIKVLSASTCLKSVGVKRYCRLLFYVRKSAIPDGEMSREALNLRKFKLSKDDFTVNEEAWFGIRGETPHSFDYCEIIRLASNEDLTGDLIYSCLRNLVTNVSENHPGGEGIFAEVMSNNLFSDIHGGRNSKILSMALQESNRVFTICETILIPVHQKERNHWSILGIYPSHKAIVHCDSLPSENADKIAFDAAAKFISKSYKVCGRKLAANSWRCIPLHRYGLQRQEDSFSCGVFACIFGYSLLTFEDLSFNKWNSKTMRYWVAKHAIKGSVQQRRGKYSDSSLWQKTEVDTPVFTNYPTLPMCDNGRIFATLRNYLQSD